MTTQSLAARVRAGETVWTAGAYDALSALLAQQAGFTAIMSTGFGVSASFLGKPDMELYSMSENLTVVSNMLQTVSVPVIADTDTGYGNALNVMRTVREFERAGVSAMIFEDQEAPKRCPAVANQVEILPIDEAAGKIRAAVSARTNPDTLIVARTDAMDEAEGIERAQAYVEAGADLIQPISKGFKDQDAIFRLREACGKPLSLQIMGWLAQDFAPDDIEQVAGFAVFPLVGLLSATKALQENFAQLVQDRSAKTLPREMTDISEFKSLIGFSELEQIQTQFLVGTNG
jgi:methylisocitrate lyase